MEARRFRCTTIRHILIHSFNSSQHGLQPRKTRKLPNNLEAAFQE